MEEVDLGGAGRASAPRAGLLRARLRLSNVTPLPSLVNPTTGGSPFFTNSQRPIQTQLDFAHTTQTEMIAVTYRAAYGQLA